MKRRQLRCSLKQKLKVAVDAEVADVALVDKDAEHLQVVEAAEAQVAEEDKTLFTNRNLTLK